MSATGPMTAVMLALHRRIPAKSRYPLPPREITAHLFKRRDFPRRTGLLLTLAAHFGFGATAGALYGVVNIHPNRRWMAKGLVYGVLVWVAAYTILLPVTRVLRPAGEQPPTRNGLMILAHLVWGLFLAAFSASCGKDHESAGLLLPSDRGHYDRSS